MSQKSKFRTIARNDSKLGLFMELIGNKKSKHDELTAKKNDDDGRCFVGASLRAENLKSCTHNTFLPNLFFHFDVDHHSDL